MNVDWRDELSRKIFAADQQADALKAASHSAETPARFAALANEAADAYEVAADGWEELGNLVRAETRRRWAVSFRTEAFTATHERLLRGWFVISDAEARTLARENGFVLPSPKQPFFVSTIRLSHAGPYVELQRISLTRERQTREKQKRSWVWAIGFPS